MTCKTLLTLLTMTFMTLACGNDVDRVIYEPVPGPAGAAGADGKDGVDGKDGADGKDADASEFDIVEVIDPCGDEAAFDEVILRLANGELLAYFAGSDGFLTLIDPGNYVTTDGTGCQFTVNSDLTVTYDVELTMNPSRDYDPSVFNPASLEADAGELTLPDTLPLVAGVAGTGWAAITVGDLKFCYQGNGVNNSDPGTRFEFVGETAAAASCPAGGLVDNGLTVTHDGGTITAEVSGGGVSGAIRTYTEVEVIISQEVTE